MTAATGPILVIAAQVANELADCESIEERERRPRGLPCSAVRRMRRCRACRCLSEKVPKPETLTDSPPPRTYAMVSSTAPTADCACAFETEVLSAFPTSGSPFACLVRVPARKGAPQPPTASWAAFPR